MNPGFYTIPDSEYFADPCPEPSLSASIAHRILQENPGKAWAHHPKGGRLSTEVTDPMRLGNLIEALIGLSDTPVVESPYDDYRPKVAREWRDLQIAKGKIPVKSEILDPARNAAKAIKAKLEARGIRFTGQSQLAIVWKENGVWCRGKLDHLIVTSEIDTATIYDLKICKTVHPDSIAGKLTRYGYDIQRAAYVSGIETLRPELAGFVDFQFIFAEPEPPYDIVVCRPDGEGRALGNLKWKKAVNKWGECLASGIWPGYADDRVLEIAPRPFDVAKAMEEDYDEAA